MEEQSHKDEMREALRGDFERLRRRHGREPVEVGGHHPPSVSVSDRSNEVRENVPTGGSWFARLRGRR